MIKPRDIRASLAGRGIDPEVINTLVALAEEQSVTQQKLFEMGLLIDQITELVKMMINVGEKMKSAVDVLKKIEGPTDDDAIPN